LDRVGRVRDALGLALAFPIITVAGTNGKGSVCAFLEAMLAEAGYKVGLYSSPHILRFNERIRIAGLEVGDAAIVAALEAVERARGETGLTYFEHTTLAAMWLFSRAGLEAAVLEVGLGGRLDAVNLFDSDCAVVTPVDIDHADYLGTEREAIAREKAGIFRAHGRAVCGDPQPAESLLEEAERLSVRLLRLDCDIGIECADGHWSCRIGESVVSDLPLPTLSGDYQLANAATAIAALTQVRDRLPVSDEAFRRGVARAHVAGRFQVVGHAPLRILDVGHNPHAARALARNLAALPRRGRRLAVLAMLADKDAANVIGPLRGEIDRWFLAGLPGARGRRGESLAAYFEPGTASVSTHEDVAAAWRTACQEAGGTDTIIAFGSFLTVAEVMAEISGRRDG
jgi:dihydrofolate synthase/folylpolyglutamate synthase